MELPYDSAIPLPGHIHRENHNSKRIMHTSVHGSTIYKSQNMEATQMSINRGLDKEDVYIYTMEYYSAIRRNEVMAFAATWMALEIIILSEVIQ